MSFFRWFLLVGWFVVAVAGCGNVTAVDQPIRGVADDAGADLTPESRADGAGADARAEAGFSDVGSLPCSAAAGCAACTAPGPTGPGYRTASQCADVIACVKAGDAGEYPWQTCHNYAGGGDSYAGLACAERLVAACP